MILFVKRKEGWQHSSLSVLSFVFHDIAFGLVHVTVAISTAVLGEVLGDNLARYTVLDGDSLYGGRLAQSECLTVHRALSRRVAAVGGVVNLCTCRTAHTYLSGVGERRVAADGGRIYAFRRRATVATIVLASFGSVVGLLYGAVVGAGHTLHHVTVAVVSGDDYAGVLQLILQLDSRGEHDTTGGNQICLHLVYVSHTLGR